MQSMSFVKKIRKIKKKKLSSSNNNNEFLEEDVKIVSQISANLLELLKAAAKRGVSVADSFNHFDRQNEQFASVNDLIVGCEELGISNRVILTANRAQLLINIITSGQSSSYFHKDHFQQFVFNPTEEHVDLTESRATVKKNRKKKQVSNDVCRLRKKKNRTKLSNDNVDFDQRSKYSSLSTVRNVARQEVKDQKVSLPEWAHIRSKRALTELNKLSSKQKPHVEKLNLNEEIETEEVEEEEDSNIVQSVDTDEDEIKMQINVESSCVESEQLGIAESLISLDDQSNQKSELEKPVVDYYTFNSDIACSTSFSVHEYNMELNYLILKNEENSFSPACNKSRFMLTVVIDIFHTIGFVKKAFWPLLEKYPLGRILIVGYPRQVSVVVNEEICECLSTCLDKLLNYLYVCKEWIPQPKLGVGAIPQFLLGFGYGANIVKNIMFSSKMSSSMIGSLGLIVLVNSFFLSDITSASLQKSFSKSKQYSEIDKNEFEWRMKCAIEEQAINECFFTTTNYQKFYSPVLLIHSSNNEIISSSFFNENKKLLKLLNGKIDQCSYIFDEKQIPHLAWLKANHNILEERPEAILNTIESLVEIYIRKILYPGQVSEDATISVEHTEKMEDAEHDHEDEENQESSSENHEQLKIDFEIDDQAKRKKMKEEERLMKEKRKERERAQKANEKEIQRKKQEKELEQVRINLIKQKEKDSEVRNLILMEKEDLDEKKRMIEKEKNLDWKKKNSCVAKDMKEYYRALEEEEENKLKIPQEIGIVPTTSNPSDNDNSLQFLSQLQKLLLIKEDTMEIFDELIQGSVYLYEGYKTHLSKKNKLLQQQAALNEVISSAENSIDNKEKEIRSIQRALILAKREGKIIKATVGGNVRKIAITDSETTELRESLSQCENDLDRIHRPRVKNYHAERKSNDSKLQVCLIQEKSIKENVELFLQKMNRLGEFGNEMVYNCRENEETLNAKIKANEEKLEKKEARKDVIKVEQERLKNEKLKGKSHVDSAIYIEGCLQRVDINVALEKITKEMIELSNETCSLKEESIEFKRNLDENEESMIYHADKTSALLEGIEELRDLLDGLNRKTSDSDKKSTKQNCAKTNDSPLLCDEVVDVEKLREGIYQKKSYERSENEKKWMALDMVQFPHFKHQFITSPMEKEEIAIDELYTTKLTKNKIEMIAELPSQVQLAFPFLSNDTELSSYFLLQKYSKGINESYFMLQDSKFVPDLKDNSDDSSPIILNSLEEISTRPFDPCQNKNLLIYSSNKEENVQTFLKERECLLHARENRTHSFELNSSSLALFLTVTITFQGCFSPNGYKPGKLAAMLYFLPTLVDGDERKRKYGNPLAIGYVQHNEIQLCGINGFGRLIIHHKPTKVPLSTDGLYQLVVGTPCATKYSLTIQGHVVYDIRNKLNEMNTNAIQSQQRLPKCKEEILKLWESMRLAERKISLCEKCAVDSRLKSESCEQQMSENHKKIEDEEIDQLDRVSLIKDNKRLEKAFTKHCQAYATRQLEKKDVKEGLDYMASLHSAFLKERNELEKKLIFYREYLPPAFGCVVSDKMAYQVANELNTEYLAPKTATRRWAGLSSIKATLPSMMAPAQKLRRKYEKNLDVLSAKEKQFIIIDRKLNPDKYEWETRLSNSSSKGNHDFFSGTQYRFKLTKAEQQLNSFSRDEISRVMSTPWNALERREIQIRKIIAQFPEDVPPPKKKTPEVIKISAPLIRSKHPSEYTEEECVWMFYDQVLHPQHYSVESVINTQSKNSLKLKKYSIEELWNIILSPSVEKLVDSELRIRKLFRTFSAEEIGNQNESKDKIVINSKGFNKLSEEERKKRKYSHIKFEKLNSDIEDTISDIDLRCRFVLRELDRAIANSNETMDSWVLHSSVQRFPTSVLRLELERELDRLLMTQIKEREKYTHHTIVKDAPSKGVYSSSSEDDEEDDSDMDEEAQILRNEKLSDRRAKNKKTLAKRREAIQNVLSTDSSVLKRKEMDLLKEELGGSRGKGCMACRSIECHWEPYYEAFTESAKNRLFFLDEEINQLKRKKKNEADSELLEEYIREASLLKKQLKLQAVDKELHYAIKSGSNDDFFETTALHGFTQMQSTENAIIALEREQSLLVGDIVVSEIIYDFLEDMLEGWVFGDQQSQLKYAGYVPSIKKEGKITRYDIRLLQYEEKRLEVKKDMEVEEERKKDLEEMQNVDTGSTSDSASTKKIHAEVKSSKKKEKTKVDHVLDETENNLRFGLFSMTLMYFRGLSLIKKQKETYSDSPVKNKKHSANLSKERLQMKLEQRKIEQRQQRIDEANKKAMVGESRKEKRARQSLELHRQRMYQENKKMKMEKKAALTIQRLYRGHLGRKASAKWKVRKAEFESERALKKAAAITMQRAYRGRLGRIYAEEKRVELAEFIEQIRAKEALEEEESYWKTHRVERVRRKVKSFIVGNAS